jgi:AbrB family looped-hinge helix DNA binding protein
MIAEKNVKVTNHGMISIPAKIRAKYNIKDGDHLSIVEDGDGIKLIPVLSVEELRNNAITVEEMREIMKKSHKEDLERDS